MSRLTKIVKVSRKPYATEQAGKTQTVYTANSANGCGSSCGHSGSSGIRQQRESGQ
jgi:hypothetical protein